MMSPALTHFAITTVLYGSTTIRSSRMAWPGTAQKNRRAKCCFFFLVTRPPPRSPLFPSPPPSRSARPQPAGEPLLDIGEAEAGGSQRAHERGPAPARPRPREGRQMLPDHRLDARVAREDREGARPGHQRPSGFAVVSDPHRRALRQGSHALPPSGHRPNKPPRNAPN